VAIAGALKELISCRTEHISCEYRVVQKSWWIRPASPILFFGQKELALYPGVGRHLL